MTIYSNEAHPEEILKIYGDILTAKIQKIQQEECREVTHAAEILTAAIRAGRKIYFFGTGHSFMMSQEVYARAGGYAGTSMIPILMPELNSASHLTKSTAIERLPEYADIIMNTYPFQEGDAIIMTSNSGRNGLIVELALRLKKLGVHVIAVTSPNEKLISRHSSGKKLCDIAEAVLNNQTEYGDVSITLTNGIPTGPTSTIISAYLIDAMMTEFMQMCISQNIECPIFESSNIDGGDQHNRAYFEALLNSRR
ncbi:MAG: sugar isomerase domain-containing protein [Erysipelotrichia bacterium]|nr:sugar isomerase domain-containing protein [Erysipelotrichia bacterium]